MCKVAYRLFFIGFVMVLNHSSAMASGTDPTRPPSGLFSGTAISEDDIADGTPKLTSIMISDREKTAVINGKKYIEGESKKGIKLLQVQRWQVKLVHNGKTLQLPLIKQTVKVTEEQR